MLPHPHPAYRYHTKKLLLVTLQHSIYDDNISSYTFPFYLPLQTSFFVCTFLHFVRMRPDDHGPPLCTLMFLSS
jgi:hypothetical protein